MINIKSYLKEVVENISLIIILSKRDLKVRYSQTLLGVLWAIIKPLSTLFIFIFMFKKIANINTIEGIPIQIIILSGIIFWNYFGTTFTNISNSITANTNLISKVYFPRLILSIASLATAVVDFMLSFVIFIIASMILQNDLTLKMLLFPIILILISLFSLGLGLLFASNSIKYRDLQHIGPLIVQYGFFITPVIYTIKSVKSTNFIDLYYIFNPLVGIIELGRYLLISNYSINFTSISYSIISTLILFIFGVVVFIKKESTFIDYL